MPLENPFYGFIHKTEENRAIAANRQQQQNQRKEPKRRKLIENIHGGWMNEYEKRKRVKKIQKCEYTQ